MGTIAFAYICFIMFIVFFFALIIFQSAVSEELGIGEGRRTGQPQGVGAQAPRRPVALRCPVRLASWMQALCLRAARIRLPTLHAHTPAALLASCGKARGRRAQPLRPDERAALPGRQLCGRRCRHAWYQDPLGGHARGADGGAAAVAATADARVLKAFAARIIDTVRLTAPCSRCFGVMVCSRINRRQNRKKSM